MGLTEPLDIEYHSDGSYGTRHAAINVKVHWFNKAQKLNTYYERIGIDYNEFSEIMWYTFEGMAELFWEDANDQAKDFGFQKVYSEGRSGGWLVPYPYITEDELEEDSTLVDRYLSFREKIRETVDGADDEMVFLMKEDWAEREKDFLRKSVSVRSMLAWKKVEYNAV